MRRLANLRAATALWLIAGWALVVLAVPRFVEAIAYTGLLTSATGRSQGDFAAFAVARWSSWQTEALILFVPPLLLLAARWVARHAG